jgi:hypothetical protein
VFVRISAIERAGLRASASIDAVITGFSLEDVVAVLAE